MSFRMGEKRGSARGQPVGQCRQPRRRDGLPCKSRLWVNYSLANGAASPYAAALLGNLYRWLEDEPEIRQAVGRLPFVDREALCGRN